MSASWTMAVGETTRLASTHEDNLHQPSGMGSLANLADTFARQLFCAAFDWDVSAPPAITGYDAIDTEDRRFRIKGRKLTPFDGSCQLSAIRNLSNAPFDYLAAVLFDASSQVLRAAIVPVDLLPEFATYRRSVNAHFVHLGDAVWQSPRVQDVTAHLQAALLHHR